MSEIVSSTVGAGTTETEQVIEDLQNVGHIDKAAKLSALLHGEAAVESSAVQEEVHNGASDQGGKSESEQNGTGQNGDATVEHNPVVKSPAKDTPVEGTETEVTLKKSEDSKPEDKSNSDPGSEVSSYDSAEQSHEGHKTDVPCGASDSTSPSPSGVEVSTCTESTESPMKQEAAAEQTEGDQTAVDKKMEELNVEAENVKGPSPAKKSCSPF